MVSKIERTEIESKSQHTTVDGVFTKVVTKVVRFLLLQNVVSQDVTKKNFGLIPDLGNNKGIYTDKQLCKLWNIGEDEWMYLDSRINNIKGGL